MTQLDKPAEPFHGDAVIVDPLESIPWHELGRARVGDGELVLSRRGDEFAIRMRGAELMNSRSHGSEELLGATRLRGPRERRGARAC